MTFGILHRYIMGEVVRAFALALLTMTIIFVLFMVMAEATRFGLSPRDIMILVPYVIPRTLPFTVPVSMLFAVTVVFGRLASDNEIIAVKTAGLSAMTVLWPAIIMGAALSVLLLIVSQDVIPHANSLAKLAIFKNFEDGFYKWLKVEREMTNPEWPFTVKVRDVDLETRMMYFATFKHRNKKDPNPNAFDMVVQADKAWIKFDTKAHKARIYLEGSETWGGKKSDDVFMINEKEFEMEIPDKDNGKIEKSIQEWTSAEMVAEQAKYRRLILRERKRQSVAAALWLGSGRIERIKWEEVNSAFIDYVEWNRRISAFETEKQFRIAQSFGSLMFVLLGAPVGIIFARRDFLSAFITCFLPVILLYYPLMLLGVNMGKENVLNPMYTLWGSNVLLGVLAAFALPTVIKH